MLEIFARGENLLALTHSMEEKGDGIMLIISTDNSRLLQALPGQRKYLVWIGLSVLFYYVGRGGRGEFIY